MEGLEGASLSVVGGSSDAAQLVLDAQPDRVETYRVFVAAPRGALDGEATPVRFVLTEVGPDGERAVQENVFRGPAR